jgi:hypothetical protein
MVYLLLYVDDIVLTTSSTTLLQQTISALKWEFTMKDLGPLHHFLGVSIQHRTDELFLTQWKFALDILERASMVDCKPVSTSVDTHDKISTESSPPVTNQTQFRSLAGALQYLTFSLADITYAVQQIYLHMHEPWEPYLTSTKRTLRYLWETLYYSLLLRCSASSELTVYSDADWTGCLDTRQSTMG